MRSWLVSGAVLAALAACGEAKNDKKAETAKAAPKAELPRPVPLIGKKISPMHLVADEATLYFTNRDGTVVKIGKDGSSPGILVSEENDLAWLAVDASHVYFETRGAVKRVPKAGGKKERVAPLGKGVKGMAARDGTVYWLDGEAGKVMMAFFGTEPEALASDQKGLSAIAVDGTYVYFTTESEVVKVPRLGGKPAVLASGQPGPRALTVDATIAAFANSGSGTIEKVAIEGGPVSRVADGGTVARMMIDGDRLLITDHSSLKAVPAKGGSARPAALTDGSIGDLAADAAAVYWNDEKLQRIMKLPK